MAGHKIDRITQDIKRELTSILREVKDPRVVDSFITVVRVEVTNDLSHCKIYISSMNGLEQAKVAKKGLCSAKGFIRHELGERIRLRHLPELHFEPTDSIEYSANISKILNDLKDEH